MVPSWTHLWRCHFQKGWIYLSLLLELRHSMSFRSGPTQGGCAYMEKGHPKCSGLGGVKLVETFDSYLYLLPFSTCNKSWKSLNLQESCCILGFWKSVFWVVILSIFESLVILVLKVNFCIIWVICPSIYKREHFIVCWEKDGTYSMVDQNDVIAPMFMFPET